MPDRYLYLLLNIGTITVPLIASFYPKANFSKTWKAFFPAVAITAFFFIVWDIWFTKLGVWGFNPRYLIGIEVLHLPIEEWLFFFTIPYACVFTYFALNHLINKDYLKKHYKVITWMLIIVLMSFGIANLPKYYTCSTFLLTAAFLVILLYSSQGALLSRFYIMYIATLIPFFIVNGILTGSFIAEQVVWYNNAENLGIRLGTIPIEDSIYGMLLLLMNVTIYAWLMKKKNIT
jgi:lycopene cyclase domain-containing protein